MPARLGATAVILLVGLGLIAAPPSRSVAEAQRAAERSCPPLIPAGSGVRAAKARSGSALPVHSLESIRICRYFGEPELGLPVGQKARVGQLAKQRLLVRSATVRRLAAEVHGLSLFPATPGGEISCPGENGASMYLLFRYPEGVRSFFVLLTGCPRLFAPARTSPVYNLSIRLKHGLEALVRLKPA